MKTSALTPGQRFAYWEVLSEHAPYSNGHKRVLALCTLCGRSFPRSPRDIINGKSKACKSCAHGGFRTFEQRVDDAATPEPNTGCLLWTKGSDQDGYALFFYNGRSVRVTREVLARKLGRALLASEQACHTCDVTACVQAAHLFVGTSLVNNRDKAAKGRQARGETCARSKLNNERVNSARASAAAGVSEVVIAAEHGVHPSTVRNLVSGKTWRHLSSSQENA